MSVNYNKHKMDLFTNNTDLNLLPYDGVVNYYGKVLSGKKHGIILTA